MRPVQFLACVVVYLWTGTPLSAQSVWSGLGTDANWRTPQNWQNGFAPVSSATTWLKFSQSPQASSFADGSEPWIINRIEVDGGSGWQTTLAGAQLSFQGTDAQIRRWSGSRLTINNDLEISSPALEVSGFGPAIIFNGRISGPGGLTLSAPVAFAHDNSYEGPTSLATEITFSKGGSFGGSGTVAMQAPSLRLNGNEMVVTNPLVLTGFRYDGRGLVNVTGNNTWAGPINLRSGYQGVIISQRAGDTFTLSGAIRGNGNDYPLVVMGAGDTIISGAISNLMSGNIPNEGGVLKWDSGTLTLSGANSFTGRLTIMGGTVIARGGHAFGGRSPLYLWISGSPTQSRPTLRLEGDETIGSLQSEGIPAGVQGLIELNEHTLTVYQTSNWFVSGYHGTITGAGRLKKIGPVVLPLKAPNSFTGGTVIEQGALSVTEDLCLGAVPVAPSLNLTLDGGTLSIDGSNFVSLHENREVSLQGTGDAVNGFDSSTGRLTIPGRISGPGPLVKLGSGVLRLTHPVNSYAGGTYILAGIVEFSQASAIGGTGQTLTINSGAAAAASVPVDQSFLWRVNPLSKGAIALSVPSTEDLDFDSSGLRHVEFGAVQTQPYSGALTAAEGVHRLTGRHGILELTRPRALTGESLEVSGTTASGKVVLSNNNELSGAVHINSGELEIRGAPLACDTAEVQATGRLALTQGTIRSRTITIRSGGAMSGCGTIEGDLINYGTISVDCAPGLFVEGSIMNYGTLVVRGGSSLDATGAFENFGRVDLLSSPGTTLPAGFINHGVVIYASDFRIRSVEKMAGNVVVRVPAVDGHIYQLQRSPSLVVPQWQNVAYPHYAYGDYEMSMMHYGGGSEPTMFYRVQVLY